MGGAVDEKGRQIGNVFDPVAQGGQGDAKNVKAEIQILAKCAVMGHGFEVAVGRTDDADINRDFIGAADTPETAILKHAQKLGLQIGCQFTDFIQKQGAAISKLQKPRLAAPPGAGKGPCGITKQFAFGETFGQGRAIKGQKWLISPRTGTVAGACKQLLAGSGLAKDQERRINGCQSLCLRFDAQHGAAGADNVVKACMAAILKGCDHTPKSRRAVKDHHATPWGIIGTIGSVIHMANRFDLQKIGLPAQGNLALWQVESALA